MDPTTWVGVWGALGAADPTYRMYAAPPPAPLLVQRTSAKERSVD